MLSTSKLSNRTLSIVYRAQTRTIFDYLAELQSQKSGGPSPSATKAKQKFTWDFVDYFKKQEPEKAEEFEREKAQTQAAENWLGRAPILAPKLDFDKWKTKVADPTFVDTLEAEYKATSEYWSKWTKYEQTAQWAPAAWAEESTRDYTFQKIPANEREVRQAKEVQAAEVMERHRELLEEIKLDYEQLEAERDLYSISQQMVGFNLHPQLAELQEENAAGKQTYHDMVLGKSLYPKYVKSERLAQAQNEQRRQIFLERWKHFSYLRDGPE